MSTALISEPPTQHGTLELIEREQEHYADPLRWIGEAYHRLRESSGRPTLCTPDTCAKIYDRIANHSKSVYDAATDSGISESAVKLWLQKGKDESCPPEYEVYRAFVALVKKALSDLKTVYLDPIKQAAIGGQVVSKTTTIRPDGTEVITEKVSPPNWQAGMTYLERRFYREFGRKDTSKIEHSGTVRNENLNVNIEAQLSDEQSAQLVNLLRLASVPISGEQVQ